MNITRKKFNSLLVVERSGDEFWGRITINGTLITDSAPSIESLKKKIKKLAKESEGIEVANFDLSYDLTSFFEQHPGLSISEIARFADINPGLMRQYASGIKYPSEERVKVIETAIREYGKELSKIKLHKPEKQRA